MRKLELNVENFLSILKEKGISIRSFDRHSDFLYSSKSVERAISTKTISLGLARELAMFLKVPTNRFIDDLDVQ